jgi:hypothetical protein
MAAREVHFDRELRRLNPDDAQEWRAWLVQQRRTLDYARQGPAAQGLVLVALTHRSERGSHRPGRISQ